MILISTLKAMDEKDSVSTFVTSDALESIASDLIKSDMSVSIEYDADGVIRGPVLRISDFSEPYSHQKVILLEAEFLKPTK